MLNVRLLQNWINGNYVLALRTANMHADNMLQHRDVSSVTIISCVFVVSTSMLGAAYWKE